MRTQLSYSAGEECVIVFLQVANASKTPAKL